MEEIDNIYEEFTENIGDEQLETNEPNSNNKNDQRTARRVANVVRKRPTLDYMRLSGPRGLDYLLKAAEDVKLEGKKHEKKDLERIMSFYFHWTHRLFPQMNFEDCLEKIEHQGTKRPVMNYLNRIKLGIVDEADKDTGENNEDRL